MKDSKSKGKDPKEEEEKEEPVEEEPKAKEEKLVMMKKGDYTVHVLIEEIKNFILIKEDLVPFPVIKVKCFDKSQRTEKTKIRCTDYVFGEHFYFDKTNLTAEMLDSEKIIIEAYDTQNSKRSDYFGIYEFDFEYIYNRPDHALHNFWLALANPESKDITQVRGYLKLSISVLHENDPRVELEVKDSGSSDCLVPAQIKMEYQQISIHIYKAEELPDMDSLFFEKKTDRECNGFIEVKYMGITRKTSVVDMKKERIFWNEIIDIPVSLPAVSQKIVMVVKDQDVGKDDIVGSIEIKLNDILAGKYNEMQFVNIYGAPLNKSGKIFDQMNFNAEIGSKWKGRILLKITSKTVDTPSPQVRKMTEGIMSLSNDPIRGNKLWNIYIKVYEAMFLPEDKRKYGIRISVQEKTKLFDPKESKNKYISWDQVYTMQCYTLTGNIDELPDVFIYLTGKKGDSQHCFQRIPASYFHMNKDIMVVKLLPDPCVGKVKNMMESGLVKIKICVQQKDVDPPVNTREFQNGPDRPDGENPPDEEEEDLEDLEVTTKKDFQRKGCVVGTAKPYTIIAVVYMSRQLIAADSNGTSDPFVVLSHGEQTKKTSVKNETVNGIWNEKLEFKDIMIDVPNKSTWPIFLLNVIDYNKVLSNTAIGYNYIWVSESSYSLNETTLKRPKWHNLFLPKSNKKQGQVMLSFYLFDKEHEHLKDQINYLPETIPYSCEINILGLRELKPLSVVPVKKAFIKFDMNSLNVTGKQEDTLKPIVTVPGDSGANPTINTVIKFDAKLPKDEIFIPDLQCEVYDHMLSGMINSLLGVFTIDVKKIIKKTNIQIDEDLRVTKKAIGLILTKGLITNKFLPFSGPKNQSPPGMRENEPVASNPLAKFSVQRKKTETKDDSRGLDHPLLDSDDSAGTEDLINMSRSINQDKNGDTELKVDNAPDSESRKSLPTAAEIELKEPVQPSNTIELSKDFLRQNKDVSTFFVIYPVFKNFNMPGFNSVGEKSQKDFVIEDEEKAPDSSLFFKVGYLLKVEENTKPEDSKKHYRRIYRQPLESVPELKLKSPFIKAKLKRGKYEDKTNKTELFDAMRDIDCKVLVRYNNESHLIEDSKSNISGSSGPSQVGFLGDKADSNEKYYGKFKGLIRICEKTKMDEYQKQVQAFVEKNGPLANNFKNLNKYEDLRKKILAKKSVIIRVYVLELNNLAKKDLLSESDPYIKLYLGTKEVINEKKNHQDDQKNCKWYKYYDLPTEIPGSGSLTLEVWDYDDLMSDDLIGSTVIDLEDRYFDNKWQELTHKPIEVRPLIHPDLSGSQGEAYMWIEIFDAEERSEKVPWSISPEPITPLEMRFIVWETEGMECMDVEGTSDIYVIGYVDMESKQSTDVHFRCQTGVGSFNWRMLLPVNPPVSNNVLTIQVYDNDIFASDDFICGATINIKNLVTIPKILDVPMKFNRDYYNALSRQEKEVYGEIEFESATEDPEGIKFWVQCYKSNKKGGRVLCSLEILPKWKADLSKVGKGRDEPNLNPFLPPPVGRFEFSLNPFKMLNQLVGPKFRRKLYCGCCLILLIIYLICFLPYILTSIIL